LQQTVHLFIGFARFSGRDILSAKYLAVSLSSISVSDGLPGKRDSKTFLWALDNHLVA
jgi:hypothetical protein